LTVDGVFGIERAETWNGEFGVGTEREDGMIRRTTPLLRLAGVLTVTLSLLAGAVPAQAAPPFPAGAQATALVGGTPLVQAICPAGSPGALAAGTSTKGGVTVGSPAGARCTAQSADAQGLYSIAGATPVPPSLRFSAGCQNSTGQNGGAVDVPAGTFVTGIGVVTQTTPIATPNTLVTYPGGTTAILNEVITDQTSVVRNAIRITSGPNAGTIIGQVICGVRYPLAVNTPSAGDAAAVTPLSPVADDENDRNLLVIAGAVGLLLLVQLPVGLAIRRRRRFSRH
jgi:hypothetical protein